MGIMVGGRKRTGIFFSKVSMYRGTFEMGPTVGRRDAAYGHMLHTDHTPANA